MRVGLPVLLAASLVAAPAAAAAAQSATVIADADTYVAASSPNTSYGTATTLRVDGAPRVAYLRFTPPRLPGPVTKAVLRIYATTSSSLGFEARSAASTSWSETTLTYPVRPAVSSIVLARTGAVGSRAWLSLDVTRAVKDSSPLTLALVTSSFARLELSSRESGATTAPRLVIDATADTTAPTSPTNLVATAGDGLVALSWSPSTDNVGVTGYRVFQDGAFVGTPTATKFIATKLTNGTRYAYAVHAVDAAGNDSPRAAIHVTPVGPPPPPPPAPPPPVGSGAQRPYDPRSPWNTPIGSAPVLNPKSASLVGAISDNNLPLTADPDQYAIPVYRVDDRTARRTVKLGGWFSSYDNGDNSRVGYGFAPTIANVPIPDGALQSAGSDGQIVLWDPGSGTEYSFWKFDRDAAGNYTAENGNRYHTGAGYHGRFADGLAGRGAGLPYLAGLVRKWEIDQGRIDHALAFAYRAPSSAFVYPASKSDGAAFGGVLGTDLPEGSRLQLDPGKTEADFDAWGLTPAAKTIARALQAYGMYVVDNSGSSKIFMEDRLTAGWDASIDRRLTEKIPWTAFRVISPPPAP